MSEIIVITVLEVIYLFLTIVAEISILNKFKETKNQLYIFVIAFLTTVQLFTIFQIFNLYQLFTTSIGTALTYDLIVWIISIAILSEFYFFMRRQRKLYSLPIVVGFYTSAGLILDENLIPLILYSLIFGGLCAILLIREGIKYSNGLTFSMGSALLIIGLGVYLAFFLNIELIRSIFSLIGMIIFNLGAWNVLDKYILIDREEKKKIKNAWIARLVVDEEK